MNIGNITYLLTGLFEALMMSVLFDAFGKRKDNTPDAIYILSIFILGILINVSNYIFNFSYTNAFAIIIISSFFSLLYNIKYIIGLIVALLTGVLISSLEILTMFLITLFFGITAGDAVNIPEYRMLGIILSKLLTLFVIIPISVHTKKKSIRLGKPFWILFAYMFAESIMVVFLIFKLSYDNHTQYMYNISVITSFALIFSTFFALYLFEQMAKQSEEIGRQRQYEQQIKSQAKHFDEILQSQKEIRKIRHDIKNHIIALRGFCADNDINGALNYLDDACSMLSKTNASVKTGNVAFDAIMNTKKATAENKNIDFKTKLMLPAGFGIDPVDICMIFGNALDNAIEACDKTEKKKISVSAIYDKNSLTCKITNTAIYEKNSGFKTTKKDPFNHGFGIENIKTALKKYNSVPEFRYENGIFTFGFTIIFDGS